MKILIRIIMMNVIAVFMAACSDHQFSSVEKVESVEPAPTGPSILVLQAPKGDLSVFDDLAVEYQVVPGSAPIAKVDCLWNGISVKCGMDKDRVKLPGGKVGGHKFEIVATDANGLQDRKNLPWKLFDKFKKHMTPFNINGKSGQVDILFVSDNSDSMDEEQSRMAQRIHSFMDQIKNLDWQIAIVTTDPTSTQYGDGRFLQFPNGQYFLTSKLDINTARDEFGKTIQRSENGSNTEEGIRAVARSIQRAANPKDPVDQEHRKFFRPSASLSVVILSDEDESDGDPINLGSELLKLVNATWSQKVFQFHSIIVRPNDTACKNVFSGHVYGISYAELTSKTQGILGNICDEDYGSQLSMIGQSVVNTQTTYALDCQPKDLDGNGTPDVLVTEAGGGSVPNFVINGDKVVFSRPPGIGQYKMEYYCPQKP
ncbi:VWA domain-containing protein [bacterium]|nr:VWA domain-containing protein [bacterium]